MSSRPQSVANYLVILLLLSVLTVITVAVSFLPLAPRWHVVAGISIGLVKATLVVLFFMHAINSPRITWCAIMASVLWLLILFSLTFTDYLTRSSIADIPGH